MTGTEYLFDSIIKALSYSRKCNIDLGTPKVGSVVGKCLNCEAPVKIRQPWLSKMEEVNDGCYLIHCTNEDCHNYYGMEIGLDELYLMDFVEWDESYIIKEDESQNQHERDGNIIPFNKVNRKLS